MLDGLRPATLARIVVLGVAARRTGELGWQDFLAAGLAVPPAQVHAREAALGPTSTADLMFTSGTTGRPKG